MLPQAPRVALAWEMDGLTDVNTIDITERRRPCIVLGEVSKRVSYSSSIIAWDLATVRSQL